LNFVFVCINCIIIIAIASLGPAWSLGLIPGLMESDDSFSDNFPNSAKLDKPAEMTFDSFYLVSEFAAENILRSRKDGRLTADITAWSSAYSFFMPIKDSKAKTILAYSAETSDAQLFFEDEDLGSDLSWTSTKWRTALCRTLGSAQIGFATAGSRARCDGKSVYPQNVFKVLKGWSNTLFNSTSQSQVIEVAHPLGSGVIRAAFGKSEWDSSIRFDQDNISIIIPVRASFDRVGTSAEYKLSHRLQARVEYLCGEGHSNEKIWLKDQRVGRLEVWPDYSDLDISTQYKRDEKSAIYVGFSRRTMRTRLLAAGLRGDKLGIDLGPFAERIDIRGNLKLLSTCYYIGFTRKVSPNWQLRVVGKVLRAKSPINGDFVGRGFLGLVNVRGEYQWIPVTEGFYGLDVSSVFTKGAMTAELWLEQAFPRPRHGGDYVQTGAPPEPKTKSLGGTSFGLSLSRSF